MQYVSPLSSSHLDGQHSCLMHASVAATMVVWVKDLSHRSIAVPFPALSGVISPLAACTAVESYGATALYYVIGPSDVCKTRYRCQSPRACYRLKQDTGVQHLTLNPRVGVSHASCSLFHRFFWPRSSSSPFESCGNIPSRGLRGLIESFHL